MHLRNTIFWWITPTANPLYSSVTLHTLVVTWTALTLLALALFSQNARAATTAMNNTRLVPTTNQLNQTSVTGRIGKTVAPTSPTWYQVEVIAFAYVAHPTDSNSTTNQTPLLFNTNPQDESPDKQRLAAQARPLNPIPPDPEGAVELIHATNIDGIDGDGGNISDVNSPTETLRLPYQLLPASAFKLNAQARKLARDKNLVLLLHIAWLQPIPTARTAKFVHFFASSADWQLSGLLTLSQKRYLRLQANVALMNAGLIPYKTDSALSPREQTTALTSDSDTAAPLTLHALNHYYQLRQHERLRLGELHYLDNPKFGLLIEVFPSESTADATAA